MGGNQLVATAGSKVWMTTSDYYKSPGRLFLFDGQEWSMIYENILINRIIAGQNEDVWFALSPSESGQDSYSRAGGILKFDGKSWTSYTTANGLISNTVISLAMDHEGGIWAATDEGITRYDGETWTVYTDSTGFLSIDYAGRLWIDWGQGMSILNGTQLQRFELQEMLYPNCTSENRTIGEIGSWDFSPDGTAWVLINYCGIARYFQGNWKADENKGLFTGMNDGASQLCTSPDGQVWIARRGGLYSIIPENGDWLEYAEVNSLDWRLATPFSDSSGDMIFSLACVGLCGGAPCVPQTKPGTVPFVCARQRQARVACVERSRSAQGQRTGR